VEAATSGEPARTIGAAFRATESSGYDPSADPLAAAALDFGRKTSRAKPEVSRTCVKSSSRHSFLREPRHDGT